LSKIEKAPEKELTYRNKIIHSIKNNISTTIEETINSVEPALTAGAIETLIVLL